MISLPIISILACFAYVIYIIYKYGIPVSISETYYILPNKTDWMFSAWCMLTALPMGIYWFSVAQPSLKWMAIVCMIAMSFIGVSCRYKSGPKSQDDIVKGDITASGNTEKNNSEKKSIRTFLKNTLSKFSLKNMTEFGWAKPIHYVNSLITIILSTVYICITNPAAIVSTLLFYPMFILIGLNIDGVYNKQYSADVDNKTWIFFMEVVCFLQMFTYLVSL